MEPKNCPFCGSENWSGFVSDQGCYYECDDCLARGPYGNTEEEAREKWNRRNGDRVYCGECKHAQPMKFDNDRIYCFRNQFEVKVHCVDWHCADGERR